MWSYGCQSTISSSVARRPVTHCAVVPTPRRPSTADSEMTIGPSQVGRRAGAVSWAQTAAGCARTVTSSSNSASVESELGERLAGEHGKPGCAPVVVVGGLRGHAFEQSMDDDDRAAGQLVVTGDPAPDVLAVVDEELQEPD